MRRPLLLLLLVILLGAALYGAWFHETAWPVRRASDPPQPLVVPPGAGVLDVGRELHRMGLVRHPELFRLLVLSRGAAGRLRAGEYELAGTMTLQDVVDKLVRGEIVRHVVTFPEGTSLEDMARIVAAKGMAAADFLQAAKDVSLVQDLDPRAEDLEGYLFPDTYDLPRGPGAAGQLVARMVKRFRTVITPELPQVAPSGRTLREIVTLASIVELETARPDERPHVASVFLNRLRRGMPLQTDPTVIYALKRAGGYDGNIHREDLDLASPYNTYRNPGLPPGPIASPGRASLLAALHPADTGDLYFVSRNDGSHQFSASLAEHQHWVNVYQRRRAAGPAAGSPAPASPAAGSPAPAASPGR